MLKDIHCSKIFELGVKKIFQFAEISSTNDWAKEFLHREDAFHDLPALVLADRQTSGRGQGNHQWWSPEGMLPFSFITTWEHFHLDRRESSTLSLFIAEVVSKTVASFLNEKRISVPVRTVPPNDVFADNKKIAGILIESPTPHTLIIGIGINLNNSALNAPDPLKNQLTTIRDLVGEEVDPFDFLFRFFTFPDLLVPFKEF
ncbi:MAG: biotin--[acetyl-CoA-carboxylase] ligase [Planctomycetia bacterium]|nr:biotin--[acetyl-CoA-carboxylase] ligase [Planctomycetia bacterium]